MSKKAILAIGLDPAFADFSQSPGLTPELMRHYIDAQIEAVRALGFDAVSCLVDPDRSPEASVTEVLAARTFDCVMIGAGLRQPPEQLLLFERILNLVHALAPGARIAFNTNPADSAEAVQRWLRP